MIETDFYTVSGGKYLALFLRRYLSRFLVPVVVVFLLPGVLSFFDYRWGVVLLMLIFILLPMAMSMLYISEALRPEARYTIRRKKVQFTKRRVVITFQDDEESPESTVALPWGTFSVAEKQKKGILLAFRENKAFLYIPFSCLESQDVDSLDSLIDSKFN